MKILAIVGSLRKESLNRQLALCAKRICQGRATFEIMEYGDVPLMNQDIEFPSPLAVTRVRGQVKDADGIWFFTPEYNHFFPGVLKNLIDWLSRPISEKEPQVLAGKPVALSGISPGMLGTALAQDHLVTLLSFLDMQIMNVPRLVIPKGFDLLKDGQLQLGKSEQYLEKQADAFFNFLEKSCG